MNTERRFGALSSSADPSKISETILGLAKVIAGLAVSAGVFSVSDSTTLFASIDQIIANIILLTPIAYSTWNSANVIFGLLQKAIVFIGKRIA